MGKKSKEINLRGAVDKQVAGRNLKRLCKIRGLRMLRILFFSIFERSILTN